MTGSGKFALALLVGLAAPLHADLKIRIEETFGPSNSVRTEYYKPHLWRREWQPSGYVVVDWANRRSFSVDTARREYTVHTVTPPPRKQPSEANADQTLVIDIETRDTGERRQIFVHPARRVVTTERRHMEYRDQPPAAGQELVTDGWYLDVAVDRPGFSQIVLTSNVLVDGRSGDRPIAFKTTGHRPMCLPVWEETGNHRMAVTEFSEAALDPTLFEPPPGFRRAIRPSPGESLSWTDRLSYYWQQILDWFGGSK